MPQDARKHGPAAGALVACLTLVVALDAVPALTSPRDSVERVSTRPLVSPSTAVVEQKLRRPECLAVLSDFRDQAGKPLSELLDERRTSAVEFFGSLRFLDGRAVPRCASGRVAAGALFGSPFIAVCRETFARVQSENPGLAANVLIHEMLHALGLGEDPPTSEEITRQVTRRCGP